MLFRQYSTKLALIPNRFKFRFFDKLNEAVYNGKNVNHFRSDFNLPSIEYRRKLGVNISNTTYATKLIPYWEIHYYTKGFNRFGDNTTAGNNAAGVSTKPFFDDNEPVDHSYFTFRRFIPNDFKVTKGHSWDQIDLGGNNCKIDSKFTGDREDQIYPAESIRIIEDNDNNFEYFETTMPSEVFRCFRVDEMPGVKPSDLPQILFLGANCKFAAKSENVNSIVCLDNNSALYSPKALPTSETVLRLKGNVFVNDSAFIAINHPEGKNYLGKNTIFGLDCYVSSSVIEDNVYIGSYCNLDVDTKIGFNSFIQDYVKISEDQSIPAYQNITTRVPACLNLLNDQRGFLLKDFDRITKSKKD